MKKPIEATAIYNRLYWMYCNYYRSADDQQKHSERIQKYIIRILCNDHKGNISYIRDAARSAARNDLLY